MVVALVAKGPNKINIPVMFWTEYDTALTQVVELLGKPCTENNAYWRIYKEHYSDKDDVIYFFFGSEKNWNRACETRPVVPTIEWSSDEETYKKTMRLFGAPGMLSSRDGLTIFFST